MLCSRNQWRVEVSGGSHEEEELREIQAVLDSGSATLTFNQRSYLTDVPVTIAALRDQLEILHVDNNYSLRCISPRVTSLFRLRWLNASYCAITSIDPSIWRLQHLERLTLNNNCLEWLPLEVWQLKSLELLHLGNNRLRLLPGSLLFLPKLRGLTVENNPLYEPEEVEGAAAVTFVPGMRSVDCMNCYCRVQNYQVFVTFHDLAGLKQLPFVHFICSDECANHHQLRLEEYNKSRPKKLS